MIEARRKTTPRVVEIEDEDIKVLNDDNYFLMDGVEINYVDCSLSKIINI